MCFYDFLKDSCDEEDNFQRSCKNQILKEELSYSFENLNSFSDIENDELELVNFWLEKESQSI